MSQQRLDLPFAVRQMEWLQDRTQTCRREIAEDELQAVWQLSREYVALGPPQTPETCCKRPYLYVESRVWNCAGFVLECDGGGRGAGMQVHPLRQGPAR